MEKGLLVSYDPTYGAYGQPLKSREEAPAIADDALSPEELHELERQEWDDSQPSYWDGPDAWDTWEAEEAK